MNVSKNNVINIKSSRKNDKSNFFVTVLNSLQNSWNFFFIYWSKLRDLWKKNTKRIQRSEYWADDQFLLFFEEIQEKSQKKKQSDAYLQLTIQKHLDQADKMRTVEHLYSMLLIFTETFEFLSNQIDSQT